MSAVDTVDRPPAQVLNSPLPAFALAALIWLAGLTIGAWACANSFEQSERQRLHEEFTQAFSVLAQRLDENEAVLHGLAALLRASPDPTFVGLRAYADEMLSRYPHLYTVGYQPRVLLGQRSDFERSMTKQSDKPFRIRDFAFDGDRRWHDSPERPVYYPVTFMAPELPDAQDVIGYDVYDDARFRQAIEDSVKQGQPTSTLPFDLVEGGRGYIFLRALNFSDSKEDTASSVRALPQHLISLLIRTDRLLIGIQHSVGTMLTLRNTHGDDDGTRIAWLGSPGKPNISFRRTFKSAHQPFELELNASPQWASFPWSISIAVGMGWTLLIFGNLFGWLAVRRSRQLRREAESRRADAEAEITHTEERAEAMRLHSLNELGSGIAHELNQPLAAILSYSQAAQRIIDLPESTANRLPLLRETLQATAAQAMRAGELMQRLRALVRRRELSLRLLVAQDWIRGACQSFSTQEADQSTIELHLPNTPIRLQGDPILLEQLLLNLLRNASEAMQAKPSSARRIVIELTQLGGDELSLRVIDNGSGFSTEQRARAFHPFQSTKEAGTGIGLVLSATVATAHHGGIDIEECVPNAYPELHGASVRLRLPCLPFDSP